MLELDIDWDGGVLESVWAIREIAGVSTHPDYEHKSFLHLTNGVVHTVRMPYAQLRDRFSEELKRRA